MNTINKINKYLLEHYPLIWNTRLFWMIIVNLAVHLLFFLIGFSTINGLEDLKQHYTLDNYFFDTSNLYYNVLISIFILLIWIIFYLRNNAFKNLYSIKKGMLFKQFCIILLIIFMSITQFFSFKKGLTLKIKSLYSWQEIDADIKAFNRTALFLAQNEADYKIGEKQYPEPFPLKKATAYRRNLSKKIDTTKSFFKYKGEYFQFYKVNEEAKLEDKDEYLPQNVYHNDFKYRIVKDVSEFKQLLYPSLLNYSKEKFSYGQDSLAHKNQLDYQEEILKNQDGFKIREALNEMLFLAKKYKIKHNLEVETWFKLIDNKPNYFLKKLINTADPSFEDHNRVKYNKKNTSRNNSISYSKKIFFNFNNTDYFFKNVHRAYFPDFKVELIYFLLIFSIFLSILIFVFKTTNLKSLLLSFVASLVILVLITWVMSSYGKVFGYSQYNDFFIMAFISFLVILFSIVSFVLKWKKIIISIFWSLVLFAVPIFFLSASSIYSKYLKDIYLESHPKTYSYKSNFEIWVDSYGFLAIILIWLLTIYTYSILIRKLKARAE